MFLPYSVINFSWVTGLLPDATDLIVDTSFSLKYAVVLAWPNWSEIMVIIKLCVI